MKRGATDRTYPHCIRQLHGAHDAELTARMLCPADYPALQGWLPLTPWLKFKTIVCFESRCSNCTKFPPLPEHGWGLGDTCHLSLF